MEERCFTRARQAIVRNSIASPHQPGSLNSGHRGRWTLPFVGSSLSVAGQNAFRLSPNHDAVHS